MLQIRVKLFGHLSTFNCSLVLPIYFSGEVYIGLKSSGGGDWRWLDGSSLSYTNWYSVPTETGIICAALASQDGKWRPYDCNNGQGIKLLCQYTDSKHGLLLEECTVILHVHEKSIFG